jgi:predicted MFS family arabinose efflux permease
MAGVQIGIGTLGTLLATAPLALAVAAIGWRMSFAWVGAFTIAVAVAIVIVVRDGRTAGDGPPETLRQSLAGIRDAWRTPSVARLFLMHVATYSSFVYLVGLWGGPYLTHVYGFGLEARGNLLLVAAFTQVVGLMLWGPTVRLLGGHKRPVLLGATMTIAAFALPAVVAMSPAVLIVWLAFFGAAAAFTTVVIAHGKSLFPPHLVGRGLTLLNMGTMGGVFLTQTVSGAVIDLFPNQAGVYPLAAYQVAFALQAALLAVACVVYLPARDPEGGTGTIVPP